MPFWNNRGSAVQRAGIFIATMVRRVRQSLSSYRQALSTELLELCNIPSPSYGEAPLTQHLLQILKQHAFQVTRLGHSLIVSRQPLSRHPFVKTHPHVALLGHLDVVPTHKAAKRRGNRIYGAGASDMKAGIAALLYLLKTLGIQSSPYQLSVIFYECEEVADMRDNGLYKLIRAFPAYFKSIDLAIIAEPTNGIIQLGCVGSQHAEVSFHGIQAHSARPWNGASALNRASTFIAKFAKLKPKRKRRWGVDFYDVMTITESASERGKTTVPSWWKANVNYRFSPPSSERAAKQTFKETLERMGAVRENFARIRLTSSAPAGTFNPTPLFKKVAASLDVAQAAKQAWTDVAQFGKLNIPAFNYGPGLTAQCHREDEYAELSALSTYTHKLENALFT